MIIDLSYIKTILEVIIEDSKLQYLLHHYFDDICTKINVNTSLSEQEISDIALATTEDQPMFGYNETSLFQDTIIYGIACHLVNTNTPVVEIPQVIYNDYISKLDLSNVSQDADGKYQITYCMLYDYCITELSKYLNDESQIGYLRRLLNLDPNIVVDKEIDFLINHYTDYIKELIPNVDPESSYFKQAIYMSVACHIYRTNPQAIVSPTEYTVDETSEVFDLSFDKFGNTWCDLAEQAMADLKKNTYKNFGVKVFNRRGARTKYNAWGPQ